jgi:hypothetical protein
VPSFGGQDISDVIRQDPSGHGNLGRLLKQGFYWFKQRLNEPNQKKQAQQNNGKAKKPNLPIF